MLERGLQQIGIDTSILRRVNWVRILLPMAAILLAAWIGRNAPNMELMGRTGLEAILVFTIGAIGAVLVLYRLEWGVFAIVATSFLLRFSISTGSATSVPASMVVASFVVLVWVLGMLLRQNFRLV